MKMKHMTLLFVLMFSLLLTACNTEKGSQETSDKPIVVATIAQIGEPLTAIAGEYVEVQTLMGTGVDPHLYQITPSDIQQLEKSKAIIYNGLNLEANMVDAFNEMSKSREVVAIAEKVDKTKLITEDDGATDPHIWFDLQLWEQALSHGVDAITKLVPEHKDEIEAKEQAYMKQLQQMHEENSSALSAIPAESRVLVTAHDAFQYFGRAYDVEVLGLQGLSTESEVSLSTVQDIVNLLVERKIPAVFVESSVNPAAIQAVIDGANVKGHTVVLGGELFSDAMGPAEEETGTYLGMYKHNMTTIVGALKVEVK